MSRGLVGKTGRVTGTVRPGGVGEVTVSFEGGSNAYLAYAAYGGEETINVGAQVEIVDFAPPSSVYVIERVIPDILHELSR